MRFCDLIEEYLSARVSIMIKINQLSKSYFARELFTDVSLQMNAGDRLGLVGRNGHGKSTLFKLILGQEESDSGEITIPRNYRIGHLEQHLHFSEPTILAEAAAKPCAIWCRSAVLTNPPIASRMTRAR